MTFDQNSKKFYDALKNSQPLAFLASFSIIIGILTWDHTSLPDIHKYAIIAGLSFIFSFVMSLLSQFLGGLWDSFRVFASGCKFLFLGIGIFYFIRIAGEFGKPIPEIWNIVIGILLLSFGGGLFIPLLSLKKQIQKDIFTRIVKQLISPIVGIGFLILGGTLVMDASWDLSEYFAIIFLIWITISGAGLIAYVITDITRSTIEYRKREKK